MRVCHCCCNLLGAGLLPPPVSAAPLPSDSSVGQPGASSCCRTRVQTWWRGRSCMPAFSERWLTWASASESQSGSVASCVLPSFTHRMRDRRCTLPTNSPPPPFSRRPFITFCSSCDSDHGFYSHLPPCTRPPDLSPHPAAAVFRLCGQQCYRLCAALCNQLACLTYKNWAQGGPPQNHQEPGGWARRR